MSDQKRKLLLLVLMGLLLAANLYRWFGDDGFDSVGFDFGDTDTTLSARHKLMVEDLARLPALSFTQRKAGQELDVSELRNPFIFGLDRRLQEQRQREMEALRLAREDAVRNMQIQQAAADAEAAVAPRFDGRLVGVMTDSENGGSMISVALNDEIHILREGTVLANKFRLERIGAREIRFVTLDGGEPVTIRREDGQ